MTLNPRRAALVGLVFVGLAGFYLVFQTVGGMVHIDLAGVTMLIALGVAMSLMAYVLFAGLQKG
jgi:hypothetical protein